MRGTISWTAWGGALAALALLTGCSDEEPSLSESSPVQWKACDTLFGAENMTSLRDALGTDGLRFTNTALSANDLRDRLTEEVVEWTPTAKYYSLQEYAPCSFAGSTRFSTTVEWAKDALTTVRSSSSPWRHSGGDVYVDDLSGAGSLQTDVIFPCRVSGAVSAQQERIPLEIRVEVGAGKVSSALHERLVVGLARSLSDELKCANKPNIPDDLKLDH
ncbi:hypothetical protein JCM4814A_24450 [Streptomyces phaeofaciens JCM 4814]|uniref:Lipoprotein n=1 Tax=Streptomyces phaeofaciens TaxID=68254 RepID=A0A918H542_9ACTN|nr:hypothetical protein [Streptomyces phaeofaciens]GGT35700.1 hypothetical protein GCM10010226_09780 [Streptomyces phaeofaciens]